MDALVIAEVANIPVSVAEKVVETLKVDSLVSATDEQLEALDGVTGIGPVYANAVRKVAKSARGFFSPALKMD